MDFTGDYLRGYSGDPAASLGAALGNIVAPALQGMEQGKADRKQRLTDQADKLGQAIKFALASKDEAGAAAYAKDLQGIMRQLHGDNAFFNQSFATLAGSPTVKSAAAPVAPSAPSAAASPAGVPAAAPAGAPAADPVSLNVPATLPPMQLFPPSPYGLDGVLSSGRGPLTLGYGGKASFDNPLAGMGQSQPEVTIPQLPGGNPLKLATAEASAAPTEMPAASPAAAQPAPAGAAPFAAMMAPENPETAGTPSIDMNYVRALARMAHPDPKPIEVSPYATAYDPETYQPVATGGSKPQDVSLSNLREIMPAILQGRLYEKERNDKAREAAEDQRIADLKVYRDALIALSRNKQSAQNEHWQNQDAISQILAGLQSALLQPRIDYLKAQAGAKTTPKLSFNDWVVKKGIGAVPTVMSAGQLEDKVRQEKDSWVRQNTIAGIPPKAEQIQAAENQIRTRLTNLNNSENKRLQDLRKAYSSETAQPPAPGPNHKPQAGMAPALKALTDKLGNL